MSNERVIKPIEISVTSGAKVDIIVSPMDLDNGKCYNLLFCVPKAQEELFDKIQGNEIVFVQIGTTGTSIQLTELNGNVFYAGKLQHARCYRLMYGNNGLPSKTLHLVCLNTPCCSFFNPGNVAALPLSN